MGQANHRQIELDQAFLSKIIDKNVCSCHINEKEIKNHILNNSFYEKCDYCNCIKKVISLENLVKFMLKGILNFYDDAANFMPYESSEGGYLGLTFDNEELINSKIGLEIDDYILNKDIIDCIDNKTWSEPELYFESERDVLIYNWNYFKDVIKYKSRYLFSNTSKFKSNYNENAYRILSEIGDKTHKLNLISKIKKNTNIYRCRQYKNDKDITELNQISSPPKDNAIYANRMSPAGISMLYCASDKETAIDEIVDYTDKINNIITTATLNNKKDLLVIDFSKLPTVPSIFDIENYKYYYSILFLKDFIKDLSASVEHNGKEHIEYVPTQVVTEYFRYIFNETQDIKINGIIYPSSKRKGSNSCVIFYDNDECQNEFDLMDIAHENIIYPTSLIEE